METTKLKTAVVIKVTGLALCFHSKGNEDPLWNVVLICDDVHKGHIKVNSGSAQWGYDLGASGRDMLVKFTSSGVDPSGSSNKLGDLFNLRKVHDRIPLKANLRIDYERRLNRKRFVWIQVPCSSLVAKDPHSVFAVPTKPRLPAVIPYGQKGQTAELKFYVTDDFTVDLGDFSTPPAPLPIQSFPVDGTSIEFSLDNGCGGECDHNDFEDIYDFVSDRRVFTEVQFQTWSATALGKELAKKFKRLLSVEKPDELGFETLWAEIRSAKYGNCDPIGIDPPPED